MISLPIRSGMPSRDSSTAIRCSLLMSRTSSTDSVEPTSPDRIIASRSTPAQGLSCTICPTFSSSVICPSNSSTRASIAGSSLLYTGTLSFICDPPKCGVGCQYVGPLLVSLVLYAATAGQSRKQENPCVPNLCSTECARYPLYQLC